MTTFFFSQEESQTIQDRPDLKSQKDGLQEMYGYIHRVLLTCKQHKSVEIDPKHLLHLCSKNLDPGTLQDPCSHCKVRNVKPLVQANLTNLTILT